MSNLADSFNAASDGFKLTHKKQELQDFEEQMANPDFWSDSTQAQKTSIQHGKLQTSLKPWINLEAQIADIAELADLNDPSLKTELDAQTVQAHKALSTLEAELRFDGPYDDFDVLMSFQAGAGGTDAQDWAEILLTMYTKWAEKQPDVQIEILDDSRGDDAGIKSATVRIYGKRPNLYGRLKGEHGVHRLVRISPFNSGGTRETSFAKVDVMPEISQPEQLEIDPGDLRIDTYRAGGNGGQSVNTTDSAVRITHIPTGVTVSMQNEKSQLQNRESAMKVLRSRLAQLQLEQHKEKLSDIKGPEKEVAWGSQIRNYVMHPYTLVKDSRTGFETGDIKSFLAGGIEDLIQ